MLTFPLRGDLFCLLLPPILWGSNFVVGRAIHDTIDPISLNYWRWVIALCLLGPISLPALWRCFVPILARWPWVLALSLLSIVFFNTLVYLALGMTTSAQGSLIHAATPFATMALSALFVCETFRWPSFAASLLSFSGAVLVITKGMFSLTFNPGDALMLVTVLVWALYSVLLKRRPTEISPLALLAVVVLTGTLIQTPLYLWVGTPLASLAAERPQALAGAVYLGVVASALAYWLWDKGIAAVGPTAASQYFHLMPLSAAAMAWAFLGETLTSLQVLGAGLVLLGLLLAQCLTIGANHR